MPGRAFLACCLNIQEGRNLSVLRQIANAVTNTPSAQLLRVFVDPVYQRSNFTIAGEVGPVTDAVVEASRTALALVDISRYRHLRAKPSPKEFPPHPHVGAVDLIPVHPMPGSAATLHNAATCATNVARRLAAAGQPVLLYGLAHQDNRPLAAVRRRTSFFARDWQARDVELHDIIPDLGPKELSQKTGVTLCGATDYVISFNVVLATEDLEVGHRIAKALREASGGLPDVEAMAFARSFGSAEKPCVEVGCNLKRRDLGQLAQAARNRVTELARAEGVAVLRSYSTNPLPEDLLPKFLARGECEWLQPQGPIVQVSPTPTQGK